MDFDPSDKIDDVTSRLSALVTSVEELQNDVPAGISARTLDALRQALEEAKRIAAELEEQQENM